MKICEVVTDSDSLEIPFSIELDKLCKIMNEDKLCKIMNEGWDFTKFLKTGELPTSPFVALPEKPLPVSVQLSLFDE